MLDVFKHEGERGRCGALGSTLDIIIYDLFDVILEDSNIKLCHCGLFSYLNV